MFKISYLKRRIQPFVFVNCIILILDNSGITQERLRERDSLFGDCWGFRSSLAEQGLTYDLIYTAEFFRNVSGAIKNGGDYRGDLSLFLEFDTAKAGWWDNGTFFIHLQEQHGYGITDQYVGDFQVLSNIDADDFKQISEIWYRHMFFNELFWIKMGKMEANEDFAFVDYGGEFINSSPGFSPTIPLVTFPDQDWGIVFGIEPEEWFSMNVGVYQGRPDGGRSIGSTLDNLFGPMLMIEPAFHYILAGHPGHFRIGGWWNGDRFDEIDVNNPNPGVYSESYGWYLTWDQEVWKENPDENSEQGIGVFAQFGWAPEKRWEIDRYIGGGVHWTGAIPSRDDDIIGLGVFNVNFSNGMGTVDDGETAIELFYKWQSMAWLSLKPELQYIINPGGAGSDDALVIGLRCEIVF